MDARVVGSRIARYRKDHNMTQQELAEKLAVTNKAVSKWETGGGLPDITMLPLLASVLEVSVDDLVSDIDNPRGNSPNGVIRRYVKKPVAWISATIFLTVLLCSVLIASSLGNMHANDEFTEDEQRLYLNYQTSNEIEVGLIKLDNILNAKVFIYFDKNTPIEASSEASRVSVALTVENDAMLTNKEVQDIAEFISNAVPGITYENIAIIDTNFNLYTISGEGVDTHR